MILIKHFFKVSISWILILFNITVAESWFSEKLKLENRSGRTIAICDLNNDLRLDMILAGGSTADICIQTNFPSFNRTTYTYPVGNNLKINGIGIHDLNFDGSLDVFLGVDNYNNMLIKSAFINDGTGKVFKPINCGIETGSTVRSILFADFNKDNNFDSFVSTNPYVKYYTGAGNSMHPGMENSNTFASNIADNMAPLPEDFWRDFDTKFANKMGKGIIIRDFNNDNKPDIIFGGITDNVWLDPRPEYQELYKTWDRGIFILQNTTELSSFSFKDISNTNIVDSNNNNLLGYSAPQGNEDPTQMQVYSIVPADFDLDGDLDLFVTGIVMPFAWPSVEQDAPIIKIYKNISNTHPDGEILFEDVTERAGVNFLNNWPAIVDTNNPIGKVSTNLAAGVPIDINNDGFIDVVNVNRLWHVPDSAYIQCAVWLNSGNKNNIQFKLIEKNTHGLIGLAREISYGDLNNDGKLDIVVADGKSAVGVGTDQFRIYQNNYPTNNHYIELIIKEYNRSFAVGSKVTIYKSGTNEILGYDEVRTDVCYRSKRPIRLHFGLGNVNKVDVKFTNRNGTSFMNYNVPVDTVHVKQIVAEW